MSRRTSVMPMVDSLRDVGHNSPARMMPPNEPDIADQTEQPRVTYLRVYLLSAALIAAGLSVISVYVAIVLGALLLPAHAIVVSMIARVAAWRPVLLKVWPFTALILALLFLTPGHAIYRLATTPEATFRRLVANPVPASVTNLEKKESSGFENWVSLTFDADAKTVSELLATKPFQVQAEVRPELRLQAGQINVSDAIVYEADYPDDGIRFTAIVGKRSNRMCFIYHRY